MQSHTVLVKDGGNPTNVNSLKTFDSAGRGFWSHISETDWSDWRWQLKNRIISLEQLQKRLGIE